MLESSRSGAVLKRAESLGPQLALGLLAQWVLKVFRPVENREAD